MLNKLVRAMKQSSSDHHDTNRLIRALSEIYTDEAVTEVLTRNEITICVDGVLYAYVGNNEYDIIAELLNGRTLKWHPSKFVDLMLQESINESQLRELIMETIISNDLSTT